MSFSRLGRRAGLWCWNLFAFTLVALALVISLVRTLLPQLDQVRDNLIEQVQQRYGVAVEIRQLGAEWQANGPHLLVDELVLPPQQQIPFTLEVDQIELKFNFWDSVVNLEPKFDRVAINGVHLDLVIQSDNESSDGYDPAKLRPLRNLLLEQIERLELSDIRLDLKVAERQLEPIHLARWQWLNRNNRHLGQGEIYLDQSRQANEKLRLSLELQPRGKDRLFGRGYLQAEELDLGAWMLRNLDDAGSDYAGVLNLESWFSFTESELLQAQWQLDGSHLRWQDQRAHQYTIEQGSFVWLPTASGWQLNSNPILVSNNDNLWPATAVRIDQQDSRTSFHLEPLALQGLKPLLALIPGLSSQQKQDLLEAPSWGTIGPIKALLTQQQLQLELPFSGLGWQQRGELPGVDGLSGMVRWLGDKAEFNLTGDQFSLNWPQQLPEPMALPTVNINGQWQPLERGSVLQLNQLQLANDDIELDLQASLGFEPEQAPQLQLAATIALHQAGKVDNYLPRAMGKGLADYLGDAIEAGHFDDGNVVWHGALNQYPYANFDGHFVAGFTMQQLRFDFLADWPAVDKADVAARFDNLSMELMVQQAELAGVELQQISIDIPELGGRSELQIKGNVTASAAEVQQVLAPTFLADSVGGTLDIVQPQQPLPISLDMSFYLGGEVKHLTNRVDGTVAFWNTDLYLEPLKLPLERVRGELKFRNNVIDASNLMATLLNQPTEISVHGENQEQGYGIDLNLASRWQIGRLPPGLQTPITSFFDGGAALQGQIGLLINDGLSFTGEVNSDLVGIELDLPAPLGKRRKQQVPLQLRVSGDNNRADVELLVQDRIGFAGPMDYAAPQLFDGYGLTIAPQQTATGLVLQQPEQNGAIYWNAAALSVEPWLPMLEQLAKPTTKSQALAEQQADSESKPWFAPLQQVVLSSKRFNLYELELGDGTIVASPAEQHWQLQLDTDRAKATVKLSQPQQQLSVAVDADFFQLSDPALVDSVTVDKGETKQMPEPLPPLDVAPASQILAMPNLDIQVDDLRFGKKLLGPAKLVAEREADHYRIKELLVGPKQHRLQAQGLWLPQDELSSTRLKGAVTSDKSDEFMQRLGVEASIADATAEIEFQLAWRGAPWQLRRDNLTGDVDVELKDGHLRQVSDKGARLLSIFSLESLARKLALDFSDVFGEGMPFEEFKAKVDLDNGIATTKEAEMDSSAGLLMVSGWTNLHTREIDYKLTFSPALTDSLPAVMYLSTGALAIGISAFAVTKLLEPVIEVVTQLRYHLSGTLDEPVLKEVERVKQEVEIRTQPESNASPESQEQDNAVPSAADDQPTKPKP